MGFDGTPGTKDMTLLSAGHPVKTCRITVFIWLANLTMFMNTRITVLVRKEIHNIWKKYNITGINETEPKDLLSPFPLITLGLYIFHLILRSYNTRVIDKWVFWHPTIQSQRWMDRAVTHSEIVGISFIISDFSRNTVAPHKNDGQRSSHRLLSNYGNYWPF